MDDAEAFLIFGLSAGQWEWVDIILGIGLVFIGVAAELAHLTKRFRRTRICGFDLGFLGAMLVTIGLAVELVCVPIVWALNEWELERERGRRVELERLIAPRDLSRERWDDSVKALHLAKSRLNVRVQAGDAESIRLWLQLKALLEEAGWQIRVMALMQLDRVDVGVRVELPERTDADTVVRGRVLANALTALGLPTTGPVGPGEVGPGSSTGEEDPTIPMRLIVGVKPLPQ